MRISINRAMRHPAAGFRLVELLLAITLMSILLGLTYRGLRAATRASARGEQILAAAGELRPTHQFIRRQLNQMLPLAFAETEDEMFEALFILTTVDTGTRVARFLLQELGSKVYKPLAKTGWLPGNIVASVLVVGAWSYLIYSGNISTIWPMFGVANQLLAAIAFGVGTIIIVKSGKLKYAWVTFIPMVFMFTTTLTAAWKLIWLFMNKAASALSAAEALTFKIDAYLVFLMALLAVIVLFDMLFKFFRFVSEGTEMAERGV